MRALAIILLCLSTINEVKTRDNFEAFDEIAINNKMATTGRFLKQAYEEQIILITDGCDPNIADCASPQEGLSPTVPSPMPPFGGSVSCADTPPQNADFGCNQYAEMKLCSFIPQENCQITCSRCPVADCDDVAPAGVTDCSDIIVLGICDADSIKGTFCRASCGDCIISAPTPIPSSTDCDDVAPPGVMDCSVVIGLGICDADSIKGTFCRTSCGDCIISAPTPTPTPSPANCNDITPPGVMDCSGVIGLGICDADSIKGTFCRASCGDCIISAPTPILLSTNSRTYTPMRLSTVSRTDCDDVAPAGVTDCSDVIGLGICDADSIKGTFCRASCGDCN